ncbi:MAG: M23 family metallopeptidase [Bacteroidia bacterium]|nr:M23 family metallopeptidase [Bacteroidia bacterium]
MDHQQVARFVVFSALTIEGERSHHIYLSAKANEFASRWAVTTGVGDGTTLPPGASAVRYVELEIPADHSDEKLSHRLVFSDGSGNIHTWTGKSVTAMLARSPALGAPLKGGPWVAVYSPDWVRGHRRVIYTTAGQPHIPGRYAIDFIRLNDKGQYAVPNTDSVRNWLGYDAPVLAVADGVVTSVRNDFGESATLSGHVQPGAADATGNYISIKIGERRFAFYEHLKPGSIAVRPGQRVKKGDVIALVGFTGQSTGPHLHFHVADTDSPLGAEGIPFVFEQFDLLGNYPDMDQLGRARWLLYTSNIAPWRNNERPAPNQVIAFTE